MFTEADNEDTAPVAIVNEAFVKRFFKSHEDPLAKRFGLDLPENVGTFQIVGIVRDAKFAGFALNRPARPMFYVPLAQNVNYSHELMKKIELMSHFIGGIMPKRRCCNSTWSAQRLAGRSCGTECSSSAITRGSSATGHLMRSRPSPPSPGGGAISRTCETPREIS